MRRRLPARAVEGRPAVAAAALERAARLTTAEADRGELLIRAADLEFELGRSTSAATTGSSWAFLVEMLEGAGGSGAAKIPSFAELANRLTAAGETKHALHALELVALRSWWGNPDQATRDLVVEAAERIPVADDEPDLLMVLAHADPWSGRRGDRARRAAHGRARRDPARMFALGFATSAVWTYDLLLTYLEAAVDGLRREGRLGMRRSTAVTEFKEFPGRPHFPGAPGWEEIADDALRWTTENATADRPAELRAAS